MIHCTLIRSDKMDGNRLPWSVFQQTHRAMKLYFGGINLCLGPFLFPAFIMHVMVCMVICSNALFSHDANEEEKMMHAVQFFVYCIALAVVLKKICWNSEPATELVWVWKQKRLGELNPVRARQLQSLSGLSFWFGCF